MPTHKSTEQYSMDMDNEGFLKNLDDWDSTMAQKLAENETMTLSEDHWPIIYTLREYYMRYHLYPGLRVLIKKLAETWGPEKANSLYIHQLFPGSIKQASKVAGLPKPLKCL